MDIGIIRKVKSKDGQIFEVEEKSLELSKVLKGLINDFPEPDKELPVNEVDGKCLGKIIDYLKHYETEKPKEIPRPLPSADLKSFISEWDYNFISPLPLEDVIELINAANFLDINDLITLSSTRIASEMINCPCEEARDKFGIKPDMSEEEMEEYDKYPLD